MKIERYQYHSQIKTYNFKHADFVQLQGFFGLTPDASNETWADEFESRLSPWFKFDELKESNLSSPWFCLMVFSSFCSTWLIKSSDSICVPSASCTFWSAIKAPVCNIKMEKWKNLINYSLSNIHQKEYFYNLLVNTFIPLLTLASTSNFAIALPAALAGRICFGADCKVFCWETAPEYVFVADWIWVWKIDWYD